MCELTNNLVMAHLHASVLLLLTFPTTISSLTTCPGFPGYCSEAFPGQSCNVVCQFGRNNVPLCQDDGTWTDIPRCIEHDPGVEDQIPGLCPGIPGYCAQNFLHSSCKFDCPIGEDISSVCTADGTWAPYPTCEGDQRETRDGCDGCPGTLGGTRNRTAEAILGVHRGADSRRVPKLITNDGGRKTVPSFAGNINIGPIRSQQGSSELRGINKPRFKGFGQTRKQQPTQKSGPRITESQRNLFPKQKIASQEPGNSRSVQESESQTRQFKQIQPPPSFGVFEAVSLGSALAGPEIPRSKQNDQRSFGNNMFFGVFESVNL